MRTELQKLLQLIMNTVKVGIVKRYVPERHTAIVEFKDFESVTSKELQVAEPFSHQNKSYSPLREGQKVLCLLLPQSGTTDGFIVGTVYDQDNPPPVKDNSKFYIAFEDGTTLEYDTNLHKLTANVKGELSAEVEGKVLVKSSTEVTIQAPRINLQNNSPTVGYMEGDFFLEGTLTVKGHLEVEGDIHATGAIIDEGGNTPHHTH